MAQESYSPLKDRGAAKGEETFRSDYVTKLVENWTKDVHTITNMAESDPRSAYCAFVFGLIHKWNYFQRTIPASPELYKPLEEAIKNVLIPKVTGRGVSDLERDLMSIPCRLGGLGIPNPVETASQAFRDSVYVTEPLREDSSREPHYGPKETMTGPKQNKQKYYIVLYLEH